MSNNPILKSGLEQVNKLLETIPEEKNGVLLVSADVNGWGIPIIRFGVATRIDKGFKLGAEAETSFSKASTKARVYAALTWK